MRAIRLREKTATANVRLGALTALYVLALWQVSAEARPEYHTVAMSGWKPRGESVHEVPQLLCMSWDSRNWTHPRHVGMES